MSDDNTKWYPKSFFSLGIKNEVASNIYLFEKSPKVRNDDEDFRSVLFHILFMRLSDED